MNGIRPAFFHSDWNLIALNTKLSIQNKELLTIINLPTSLETISLFSNKIIIENKFSQGKNVAKNQAFTSG
jgi:hypothetical protein